MPLNILEQNLEVIEQGIELIRSISPVDYASTQDRRAGVGPHMRHCVEFYGCFVDGAPSGRIDYDARPRILELETDARIAVNRLEEIARELSQWPAEALGTWVEVRLDAPANHDSSHWSRSTQARELQFLLSHSVHHYALIALLLDIKGKAPRQGFGVAPSTLKHRHQTAEHSRLEQRTAKASS